MDRRTLLALAASLPAFFTPASASACSVALKSPRSSGLENQQVRNLFEAWWDRDATKFRSIFTDTLMSDGTAMESGLAADLLAANPLAPGTFGIFERFFTDKRLLKKITLIVNTDAGVIVAAAEASLSPTIQPDCSGMPKLHLFLVTMSGLNARSIAHLASSDSVAAEKFSIWTEGSG